MLSSLRVVQLPFDRNALE